MKQLVLASKRKGRHIAGTSSSDIKRRSRKIGCPNLPPISCTVALKHQPSWFPDLCAAESQLLLRRHQAFQLAHRELPRIFTVVGCIAWHHQRTCEGGASCRNSGTTDLFTEARGDQHIRVFSSRRLFLRG